MGLLSSLSWGMIYLVILFTVYITYVLHSHKVYFKKRKLPYIGFGLPQFLKVIFGKISFVESELITYKRAVACNSPIVGFTNIFNLSKAIYVTDMETMKNVFVKDFDHFINRPPLTTVNKKGYLPRMLGSMENEHWKIMRAKLTPILSTGKIKRMFENFRKSSEGMTTYINGHMGSNESKEDLDFSQLLIKYTMDVIAGTAFGYDSKTWETPVGQQSTFEKMGHRYQFSFSPLKLLQFMLLFVAPRLYDFLGFELMDGEAEQYFADIIKQMVKHRRQTGERREDFLQYILDMQAGILKADDDQDENISEKVQSPESGSQTLTFDDEDVVGFSMQFLLAGFDTTQSALIFALYSLALEKDVQEKLYEEVGSKMNSNGGKLTYESLMEMTYLDYVISESLRMYNPNTQTIRVCTKDYLVPGTNFTIEKGTFVSLPQYPSQLDERHYPNPDKFIPERFTPENKQTRSPFAWNPFGHGLRGCIAMRFALVKVKVVIAYLVYSFQFSPSSKTLIPIEFSDGASLKPKGGLWMKVARRK